MASSLHLPNLSRKFDLLVPGGGQSQFLLPVEQLFYKQVSDIPLPLYCMIELTLSNGQPIPLQPGLAKKFRGTRLPGAELFQADEEAFTIAIHEYAEKLFRFLLISIQCRKARTFFIHDASKYLRFETVVTGQWNVKEPGNSAILMLPGQYRFTESKSQQLQFSNDGGCQFFIAYISPELRAQTPLSDQLAPGTVSMMTSPMREVILKILDNPYEHKFRHAFYDYTIRELLFFHLSAPPLHLPGEMNQHEIASVFEADRIIAANLDKHYSINELARLTRTNAHVLKSGFARIFGMGSFERLLQRKMDKAKNLLESTDMQIQQISFLSGYDTVTGFINAFRKHFKMSPRDWRKKSREV